MGLSTYSLAETARTKRLQSCLAVLLSATSLWVGGGDKASADLIPSERLVNWIPGVTVGVPGGIPSGRTNLRALLDEVRPQLSHPAEPGARRERLWSGGIDVLELTLNRIKYVDLGDARNNRDVAVNLQEQIFRQVRSEQDWYGVVSLIWLRSGGQFKFSL